MNAGRPFNSPQKKISGLHCLEACKLLGLEDIDCVIKECDELDKELVEIDENLIRAELTVLERAELLKRRKEIYEAKHQQAKAEERRKLGLKQYREEIISARENIPPAFTIDTANKTGFTPRTIRHEVYIAEKIVPEIKETIKNTELADSKVELLKLAKLEPEQQKEVAKGLFLYKLEKSNKIRIHLTHFLLDICGSL